MEQRYHELPTLDITAVQLSGVLAVPVAPHDSLIALRNLCDDIVCLAEPQPFRAVGLHYQDFHQVGDDEVLAALESAAVDTRPPPAAQPTGASRPPPAPAAG